uniref:Uncharacterized protein n=1 Tax=Rhizophora mucronata TaxID=61149 RepID=A0A2P2IYP8_RHIMU
MARLQSVLAIATLVPSWHLGDLRSCVLPFQLQRLRKYRMTW